MPGQERLGGGPTPQRRESTKAGPRVVGAKERVVGAKARRDPPAFPLRPRAVIPGSDGQGHRPRGWSLQQPPCPAQAPCARPVERTSESSHSASVRAGGPAEPCAFRAPAGVFQGLRVRAASAPGWERHPERIRCKAGTLTEDGRKRAASSGATAGPAESRGGPGALKTLRSSATAAPPP